MAYRATALTEERRLAARERILVSAHALVARGGWPELTVAAVAADAGVATGSVYRHFGAKAELCAEVFRRAAHHEVEAVAAAARQPVPLAAPTTPDGAARSPEGAAGRVTASVETFARRALAGRRLAWALLAEPVDPVVDAERLAFRRAYADVFAVAIAGGIEAGELPEQDPDLTAALLVGAIGEALVGPLSPVAAPARTAGGRPEVTAPARTADQRSAGSPLIDSVTAFCLRAIT